MTSHHRPLRLFSLLILMVGLLSMGGCKPKSGKDHFALAKQLETQLGLAGDYASPGYEQVAQELMLAQEGDDTWEQSQTWLKDIQKARSDALWGKNQAPEVQEGGDHAPVASAAEQAAARKPAGAMTAAGWMPYNDVAVSGGGNAPTGSGGSSGKVATTKKAKGPIILYGTSWCGVCAQARAYFRSRGVSFIDKDVEKDASAMAEFKRKAPGATGYPVIDLGGEIMPGFSATALDSKLGI